MSCAQRLESLCGLVVVGHLARSYDYSTPRAAGAESSVVDGPGTAAFAVRITRCCFGRRPRWLFWR